MYKIGVIGYRESVLGFKAVGLDTNPGQTPQEAWKVLHRIAQEEYAIIYITEGLCKDMEGDIAQYHELRIPAIIPIPGKEGSYGIGIGNVKKSVERAVGADILFGGE